MKKRPLAITLVSLICISMAPLYLVYHLWYQKLDPLSLTAGINPIHFLIAFMALPVGFGVYKVQKWGYVAFLFFSVTLVTYFLYQYFASPVLHNYLVLLGAVALLGGVSLLLQQHITAPYFDPKLKWWERDPRYRVNLQAEFQIDGDVRAGSMLDLSMSGCYATVDTKLIAGDTIYVNLALLDHKFKAMAKVIWVNDQNHAYGIMFTDIERDDKKELKSIINYLVLSHHGHLENMVNVGVPERCQA